MPDRQRPRPAGAQEDQLPRPLQHREPRRHGEQLHVDPGVIVALAVQAMHQGRAGARQPGGQQGGEAGEEHVDAGEDRAGVAPGVQRPAVKREDELRPERRHQQRRNGRQRGRDVVDPQHVEGDAADDQAVGLGRQEHAGRADEDPAAEVQQLRPGLLLQAEAVAEPRHDEVADDGLKYPRKHRADGKGHELAGAEAGVVAAARPAVRRDPPHPGEDHALADHIGADVDEDQAAALEAAAQGEHGRRVQPAEKSGGADGRDQPQQGWLAVEGRQRPRDQAGTQPKEEAAQDLQGPCRPQEGRLVAAGALDDALADAEVREHVQADDEQVHQGHHAKDAGARYHVRTRLEPKRRTSITA